MNLPLFRLLDTIENLSDPGELVGEERHEKAAGAYQRQYEIPEGFVIVTLWQDKLHEVVFPILVGHVVKRVYAAAS